MNIKIPLIICVLSSLGTILGSSLVFIPNINKISYKRNIMIISSIIMLLMGIALLIFRKDIENWLKKYNKVNPKLNNTPINEKESE